MKPIRLILAFAAIALFTTTMPVVAADVVLSSPDEHIAVRFRLMDQGANRQIPVYDVQFKGKQILSESKLGLQFQGSGALQQNLVSTSVSLRSHDETYDVVNGKSATARDHYDEATVSLQESAGLKRKLVLSFRAYDDGVAFRYTIPQQENIEKFVITDELSHFSFTDEPTVYHLSFDKYANPHEGPYKTERMSVMPGAPNHVDLPVLMECKDGNWIAITEAALTDYAGLFLNRVEGANAFISDLTPSRLDPEVCVRGVAPHISPWRVIMIGDNPGALITSSIILDLNEPCQFEDTSWTKPGKTTWHWWNGTQAKDVDFKPGMNTATMKHYIDFCAANDIDYHALVDHKDLGWYGNSRGDLENEDMTTAIPEIDLSGILDYAGKKGVGIRLWLHQKNVRKQMKEAFPLYEKWGIKGFMMDFLDHSDQETMQFAYEVLQEAAKHHLKVQLHGAAKPTGLRRTYPNLMNIEYLLWAEGTTPQHNVTVPFTRMLAGPMDYHLGGFRSVMPKDLTERQKGYKAVVIGTRCHHLAMYVVYENPMPMVADYPEAYRNQLGFEFIREVPTVWDETRVLNAKVGDYITIARRRGKAWYIGSMTDWTARELEVPLGFLSEGVYTATVYSDTEETKDDPNVLRKDRYRVTSKDTIDTKLGSGGGLVIVLRPSGSESVPPR